VSIRQEVVMSIIIIVAAIILILSYLYFNNKKTKQTTDAYMNSLAENARQRFMMGYDEMMEYDNQGVEKIERVAFGVLHKEYSEKKLSDKEFNTYSLMLAAIIGEILKRKLPAVWKRIKTKNDKDKIVLVVQGNENRDESVIDVHLWSKDRIREGNTKNIYTRYQDIVKQLENINSK